MIWFSTDEFAKRYNVSHKTHAAGTKELMEVLLLTIERGSLSSGPTHSVFDTHRKRNAFRLTAVAQINAAAKPSPPPGGDGNGASPW
ncbi:hypothetical protein [Rhodococcus opacus]|uniref:Uncharacterized protein n=1 Tax=Rhodococcus opacus TaxID=37919 RepID=A0A076EZJ5_RHOOP|nr:hypothetical protein [Rhodococcus opacus]AII11355.1 hypothetical protein EP51_45965 [Rhodococcus opacus]